MGAPRISAAIRAALADTIPMPTDAKELGASAGAAWHQVQYDRGAKGVASTGRSIQTIFGAARDRAIRSNNGGGPVRLGGGGIATGDARFARSQGIASGIGTVLSPLIVVGCQITARAAVHYAEAVIRDRAEARQAVNRG